jgi:hypothetical protein
MQLIKGIVGFLLGTGLSFAFNYFLGNAVIGLPLIIALIAAAPVGIFSSIALAEDVYELGFFSIVGYVLDVSWSALNTIVGLLYIPVCLLAGGGRQVNGDTQRSGSLCYLASPRGAGWRMTLGTVIGGGWDRHEEVHVWQARIFGPVYFPVYGLCLGLNMLFRLLTGKLNDLAVAAYRRVCFEDWAYAAGAATEILWLRWFLWFFISAVYVTISFGAVFGLAAHSILTFLLATALLVIYSLIRAFAPTY